MENSVYCSITSLDESDDMIGKRCIERVDSSGNVVQIHFQQQSDDEFIADEIEIKEDFHGVQPDSRLELVQQAHEINVSAIDESRQIGYSASQELGRNKTSHCPVKTCRLRFPSQASLLTHIRNCHRNKKTLAAQKSPVSNEIDGDSEVNQLNVDSATVIWTTVLYDNEGKGNKQAAVTVNLECNICDFKTDDYSALQKHVISQHQQDLDTEDHRCELCHKTFSRKNLLAKHMRSSHQEKKSDGEMEVEEMPSSRDVILIKSLEDEPTSSNEDVYHESSVPKGVDFKCVCTWCEYKSNKYSMIKKHVALYHELENHYPCKDCSYEGKSVDEYAEHFNKIHKTDHYRHACTDCSFKTNNRIALRDHYLQIHRKKRLHVCKFCNYKAQDQMSMKRHLDKMHARSLDHPLKKRQVEKVEDVKIFKCCLCSFYSLQADDLLHHMREDHFLPQTQQKRDAVLENFPRGDEQSLDIDVNRHLGTHDRLNIQRVHASHPDVRGVQVSHSEDPSGHASRMEIHRLPILESQSMSATCFQETGFNLPSESHGESTSSVVEISDVQSRASGAEEQNSIRLASDEDNSFCQIFIVGENGEGANLDASTIEESVDVIEEQVLEENHIMGDTYTLP